MKHKAYLAFYKAWNNKYSTFEDRAIAVWTNGPYSHVEMIIYDEEAGYYKMCSALGNCNCVRCKKHRFNTDLYDYLEIELEEPKRVLEFFDLIKGSKYDYLGIVLSQIFPLGVDNPNEWFCSEVCTKVCQLAAIDDKHLWKSKPESLSPNLLAYRLGLIKRTKKKPFIFNLNLLFKKHLHSIYTPFNIMLVNSVSEDDLPIL